MRRDCEFKTTDSGEREKFSTGSHRDIRSGKGRFDLLPVFALERDAGLLERGAEKYDARNWEQGFQFSRCLDSTIRHLVLYLQGESVEDHLAAARFNIACVMHYEEMIHRGLMDPALNDLPNYAAEPAGEPYPPVKNPAAMAWYSVAVSLRGLCGLSPGDSTALTRDEVRAAWDRTITEHSPVVAAEPEVPRVKSWKDRERDAANPPGGAK